MNRPSHAFEVEEVRRRLEAGNGGYEIVHASPGLEVGVYVLVAPEPDTQQPHADDEVYVVLEGRGVLNVEGDVDSRVPRASGLVPAGANPPVHRLRGPEHPGDFARAPASAPGGSQLGPLSLPRTAPPSVETRKQIGAKDRCCHAGFLPRLLVKTRTRRSSNGQLPCLIPSPGRDRVGRVLQGRRAVARIASACSESWR